MYFKILSANLQPFWKWDFKCIFVDEPVCISIRIKLNCIPRGPIGLGLANMCRYTRPSWIQIRAFILFHAKPCKPSIGSSDAGVTRCLYSGYQLMLNENVVILDKKSSHLLAAIIGSSFALVVFLARDYLPCIFTSVPWVYCPDRVCMYTSGHGTVCHTYSPACCKYIILIRCVSPAYCGYVILIEYTVVQRLSKVYVSVHFKLLIR